MHLTNTPPYYFLLVISLLKTLISVPAKEHVYYDRDIAAQREKHGDSLLTILQRKLADQEVFEAEKQRIMDETRRKREAEKQKQDEEEKVRRQKQEEEEREILERRRALDQGAKETQKELDEMNRERSERKRMVVSDDELSENDLTGDRENKRQKKERKPKEPREPKEPKEPKEPREKKGKLRKKSEVEGGRGRSKSVEHDDDDDDSHRASSKK